MPRGRGAFETIGMAVLLEHEKRIEAFPIQLAQLGAAP
jgi:hypothetical protein